MWIDTIIVEEDKVTTLCDQAMLPETLKHCVKVKKEVDNSWARVNEVRLDNSKSMFLLAVSINSPPYIQVCVYNYRVLVLPSIICGDAMINLYINCSWLVNSSKLARQQI